MIGETLGHYKVLEQLGRGGMGEVYLAEDLSLDRKVALKFLPDAFTSDPERMARFEREAKLLASLNHPNIAAIYGLEQADGKRFLVLEYVEGETLQARLNKGALPVEDALGVCRQIAEGLEAAQEKGVVHRDLKPANVMITAEEKVKILDFGLAKALADEIRSVESSHSPTITEAMTQPGVVLGTAAYMSPEQAKGKAVDKRADIWAFGCILYECLTGKRVFEGETVTETLAAILRGEPDWQILPTTTPINIQFVLRRCLNKDISRRFRDAADVQIQMEEVPDIGEVTKPVKHNRLAWIWAAIATLLAIALAVPAFVYFHGQEPGDAMRFYVEIPFAPGRILAVSPDGRYIAFVADKDGQRLLWLHSLAELENRPLQGTDGALYPFWSYNSRFVGFGAEGKLKKIDISGGYPGTLCDLPDGLLFRGGTWSSDDVLLFMGGGSSLYRIPADGGTPVAVTAVDQSRQETSHRFPSFLPDGQHFLFTVRSLLPENHGIYVGSLDSGERKRVINVLSNGVFAAPGFLLFARDGELIAQRFDPDRLEVTGEPVTIVQQLGNPRVGYAPFTASETGLLAYSSEQEPPDSPLIWMSRDGRQLGEAGGAFRTPALSPDGSLIAVTRCQTDTASTDIWLIDSSRGVEEPLTRHAAWDQHPVWSPDGLRIVFSSPRDDTCGLFQIPVDGSGSEERILDSTTTIRPTDWSPDGRFIVYRNDDPLTNTDLWALPLFGDGEPFPIARSEFGEAQGSVSPDGRWIAYSSDDSGRSEIYVHAFPTPKQRWTVTVNGGSDPKWSHDGKELFYAAADGKLMAVPVTLGEVPDFGAPVALFDAKIFDINREGTQYDVSDDGQRFVLPMPNEIPSKFTVILNWASLLIK